MITSRLCNKSVERCNDTDTVNEKESSIVLYANKLTGRNADMLNEASDLVFTVACLH